jgi:hypothetical protein
MRKLGRFLYLTWPKGAARWNESRTEFVASHDGWKSCGGEHQRRIRSTAVGAFLVEDLLTSRMSTPARLHWLLADQPYEFQPDVGRLFLHTPAGDYAVTWKIPVPCEVSLVRADPASARGWWAPRYGQAQPALSVAIEFTVAKSLCLETSFAPA